MTKSKSDPASATQNATHHSRSDSEVSSPSRISTASAECAPPPPASTQTTSSAGSTASTQQTPLPPQDLESLQLALANAQQKLNEMTEIAKRATADLQNFKRRNEEERGSLILFANTHFLQGIFPVIDNLQRAFQHIPEDVQANEWVKGLYAIEKQLISTLNNLGLEEIPTLIGSPFNPNFHEVVTQGPGQKDAILECFEKGYTFKGQTIRPARVKVGDGTHEATHEA
ncbi:MAG: nucleotide exchange factor GrpE [Candidatus Gracilibacteria bacterium]